MSKFSIGDRVKVVRDFNIWLDSHGLPRETLLTVVQGDDDTDHYVIAADETIEITAIETWPADFEKVEDTYFAGLAKDVPPTDAVRPARQVTSMWELNKSDNLEDLRTQILDTYKSEESKGTLTVINNTTVEEAKVAPITALTSRVTGLNNSVLGVYRPNLNDRKVGKVQMHMVDDGFPNALREVAKVMTWAADAKGYKLHDWKNLPEADVAFPSAGYRHRNDSSIQKAQGIVPIDRTDHESALLHKAHEAFNVLAELELILTGVIK